MGSFVGFFGGAAEVRFVVCVFGHMREGFSWAVEIIRVYELGMKWEERKRN